MPIDSSSSSVELAIKLKNALWLKETLVSDNPALEKLCTKILNEIYLYKGTQRKNIYKHIPQLKVLILNLLIAIEYHGSLIAISKARGDYSSSGYLSYRVMVDLLVNSLVGMKYLKEFPGFFGGLLGKRSKFEILAPLKKLIFQSNLQDSEIYHQKPKQLVTLKDQNKTPIKIIDLEYVRVCDQLTQDVDEINKRIQSAFIDLILTNEELTELELQMSDRQVELDSNFIKPRRLDFSDKWLSRTFNNTSFEQGGRFYGGWWQTIPKGHRPFITIDNWFTEELDYSGMHINLLYNRLGIDTQDYFEDPYLIPDLDETYRNTTKIILLIMINARTDQGALRAINEKAKNGEGILLPPNLTDFRQYINLIKQYHVLIKDYFGSGAGIRLQNLDSRIATSVMLRMSREHQATCLPIHDSFIVADPYVGAVKEIMTEEYEAQTGFKCRIEMKSSKLGPVDSEERLQMIDHMYESYEEELWGYRCRIVSWMKKTNPRYETEGGVAIDEKPRRLKTILTS